MLAKAGMVVRVVRARGEKQKGVYNRCCFGCVALVRAGPFSSLALKRHPIASLSFPTRPTIPLNHNSRSYHPTHLSGTHHLTTTMAPSARDRVFAILELFDEILSHASQLDLLRAMQVNKHFHSHINSSSVPRKILVFDQGSSNHDDRNEGINKLLLKSLGTKGRYGNPHIYDHTLRLPGAPIFTLNYQKGDPNAKLNIFPSNFHGSQKYSYAKTHLIPDPITTEVTLLGPPKQVRGAIGSGEDDTVWLSVVLDVVGLPLGRIFDVAAMLHGATEWEADRKEVLNGAGGLLPAGAANVRLLECRVSGFKKEFSLKRLY